MAHRPGHYGLGGASIQVPSVGGLAGGALPGFMSPENYRRLGRGLLDFVPGVSTALNWPQMGPWGRAGSVGLDALDLATLGGGKPFTTPARWLSKAFRNPLDPKMISVRAGFPPISAEATDPRMMEGFATPAQRLSASEGAPLPWGPSTNYIRGQKEAGTSVYQAAQFPFGRGSVLRPAEDIWFDYTYPNRISSRTGQPKTARWNPLIGQTLLLRDRPMYQVMGDVIPGAKGSDLEAMVDPATISGVTQVPFSQLRRLPLSGASSTWPHLPTGLTQGTGLSLASEGMTNRALNLFAKYDPQGTLLDAGNLSPFERSLQGADLPWTLPWTATTRGGMQTVPNLEEMYQRRLGGSRTVGGGSK